MKNDWKNTVLTYFYVVLGTFILCLSVEMFILPYNVLSGGVAGVAVALQPLLHFSPTMIANGLTVFFLFLGGLTLGKKFLIQTFLSSLLYPIFNSLLEQSLTIPVIDPMLASFYGGLLGGVGVGIVLRAGASTGGMDIPPLIIHKYTGIKVSTLVAIVDICTVLLGLFTYGLTAVLIGLISVFVMSITINKVLSIGSGMVSKSVQIISDEWEGIAEQISIKLDRSATILDAVGAYTGDKRKVLLVVVSHTQYTKLIEIINEYDKHAFVITTDATDMHGEGFTYTGI